MKDLTRKNGTRNIFFGALIALFLTSWVRAAIYYLNRDEIQEMSRLSSAVADNNREFIIAIQDPLNIAWILAPILVAVLMLVPLFLGIGHWVFIWITGTVGSILFAAGLIFPTNTVSKILAAFFLIALFTVVYLVIAQADKIMIQGKSQQTTSQK